LFRRKKIKIASLRKGGNKGKSIKTITGPTRSGDLKVDFCLYSPTFACLNILLLQISMAFSDDYATILSPFVEKYKTAKNENARKSVLKNAADAVKKSRDLREDNVTELPKELETVCPYFYSLCSSCLKDCVF
jgi:hypothetical protein